MGSLHWHEGKGGVRYGYVQGVDRDGNRYSRRLGAVTPEEAMILKARIEEDVEARAERPVAMDAREAFKQFIASKRVARATDDTIDYYTRKLEPVVVALGARSLRSWRPVDLEAYLGSKAKDWAPSTARKVLSACREFVRWAQARGVACPDFTKGVKTARPVPFEGTPFTEEEEARIFAAAAGTEYEVPVALARWAGLSRGDLKAIVWAEVDFDAGLIRRRRQKTGYGKPIPIAPPLLAVLERHRATHGPVCRDMPQKWTEAFKRLLRRAGVGGDAYGAWHRLRHTYGMWLGRNTDPATAGDLLQHRPASGMTLRYFHTNDAKKREVVARMSARA